MDAWFREANSMAMTLEPLNYSLLAVGAIITLVGLRTNRLWHLLAGYTLVTLAVYLWLIWVNAAGDPGAVPYFAMVCGSLGVAAAAKFRHFGQFAVAFLATTAAVSVFTSGGKLVPDASWGRILTEWLLYVAPQAKFPMLDLAPLPAYALPPETVAIVALTAAMVAAGIAVAIDFYGEAFFLSLVAALLVGLGVGKAVVVLGGLPLALLIQLATNAPKSKAPPKDSTGDQRQYNDGTATFAVRKESNDNAHETDD